MKNKFYLWFVVVWISSGALFAQTAVLSGKVTSGGTPVPGASVQIVGTNIGGAADADGNYRITNVPIGSITVKVSSIGFDELSQNISLLSGENRVINFSLKESAKFLEDVIITGLSINAKQKELGTSRANVGANTIETLPAPTVENVLVGRLAGVEAFSTDGAPGGGFRFRIRGGNSISGASEPLVIVDGIFMDNANRNTTTGAAGGNNATGAATFGMQNGTRGLGALNPEDIESIEILKGAAAASLYGSRAAAGVIVVKTKAGGKGKLTVDYSVDAGTMEVSRGVDKYKMNWNASEIEQWVNLINPARNIYTDANLAQYRINPLVNYPLESFRRGTFTRHTFRVQGGNQKFGYYISGNTQSTIGHIKGTDFKTKGVLLSLSSQPLKGLSLRLNVNYQDALRNQVASGTPGFFVPNRWAMDATAMPFMRYQDVKNNVVGITNLDDYARIQRENLSERVSASANLNYKLTGNFAVDVNAGIDKSQIDGYTVYPAGIVSLFPTGRLDRDYEELSQKTLTVGLNHSWQISSKFYIKSAAGTQYDENSRFYDYTRWQVLSTGRDFRDTSAYTAPQRPAFFQVNPIVKTLGIYFNETFGFGEKFFVNVGGRFDRSTSFIEQFFFYPRASISYQATPNLRWRAAYGVSGTQPVPYLSTLTFRSVPGGYNGSGAIYVPNNAPKPDLRPETQTEIEVGFDANLFNERLRIEMTYYNKQFDDLLLSAPVNPALNFGLVSDIRNVGSMYNRGLELMISGDVIQTNGWNWNLTFTGSTLDNKVTRMPQPPTPIPGGIDNIVQIREGYPLGGIWAGVPFSAAPDAPPVALVAGQAVRVFRGNTLPRYEGNINSTLTYKGLTFNMLVGGKAGFYRFNQTARDMANPTKRQHVDFWNLPTAQLTPIFNDQNRWVERGDFLKLRQLTLSYNVPTSYLKQTRFIKRCNIGFTGANLFVWTKYSGGYDVEAETSGSGATNAWARGIDSWDGGMPRTYTLSFNIGF
ncbi:MAG: SusC/RagA family TonB-linked outer membrane protein [Runella sp.]